MKIPDIRDKKWRKIDSKASKIMNLLVEAEDLLIELDDFQMNNNQCYPDIEEFMLQIGELRKKYSNFVEENIEILEINI